MLLKITGMGLFFDEHSYLRSGWNWLDMSIVLAGIIQFIIPPDSGMKVSILRMFRVIRPLKTISSLKNLITILSTLLSAMPYILNTLLILCFFLVIYSIIALQVFKGNLKRRCFDPSTGFMLDQKLVGLNDSSYSGVLCGYDSCIENYICGKMVDNPNEDTTSFDNILWTLYVLVQGITLENWSYNMYYVIRTTDYIGVLFFFISLSFIGAFIFVNLLASVISNSYHEQANMKIKKRIEENNKARNYEVEEYIEFRSKERFGNKIENFINGKTQESNIFDIIQSERGNDIKMNKLKPDNKLVSIEELTPLFLNNRKSLEKNGSQVATKKNSDEKNEIDGKNGEYSITQFQTKLKIVSNGNNNQINLDTEAEKQQQFKGSQSNQSLKNTWTSKLRLKNIFKKDNSKNLKEKYKKYKLEVNFENEYESENINDVIEMSLIKKNEMKERIFAEKIKRGKYEICYKTMDNIQKIKIDRKKNNDFQKMKEFMRCNENEGNEIIKSLFKMENGKNMPLKISPESFSFQKKIESLFDKQTKNKKKFFLSKINIKYNKEENVRKKKRLKSLVFSQEEIAFSLNEILDENPENKKQNEEFINDHLYKSVLQFQYENKKITDKINDLDIDLRWSGRDILDFENKKKKRKVMKTTTYSYFF